MSIHINPHAVKWPKVTTWVHHLVITPDSKILLGAGMDRRIHVWDIENRESIREMEGHNNSIRCLAMSSDGKFLLSGADEGDIRMWELEPNYKCINVWKNAHKGAVRTLALSKDCQYCISGGDDGVVQMWKVATGEPLGTPGRRHTSPVCCVAFTDSGQHAGSGDEGGVLSVWNTSNEDLTFVDFVLGPEGLTCAVALPGAEEILTSCRDTTILRWALNRKGSVGEPWRGHTESVQCVGLFANAEEAVTGSADNTLRLWDLATGTALGYPWKAPEMPIETLAIAPNSEIVISAGADEMWSWTWEVEIRPDHPDDVPLNEEDAALRKKLAASLEKFAAKRPATTFKIDEPLPPQKDPKPMDASARPSSKLVHQKQEEKRELIAKSAPPPQEAKEPRASTSPPTQLIPSPIRKEEKQEALPTPAAVPEPATAAAPTVAPTIPAPEPVEAKAPASPVEPEASPVPTPAPKPIPAPVPANNSSHTSVLLQASLYSAIALTAGVGMAFALLPDSSKILGKIFSHSDTTSSNAKSLTPKTNSASPEAEHSFREAMRYMEGNDVPRDYRQAVFLLQKAASSGHPAAKYHLGIIYLHGLGVTPDKKRAVQFLEEASDSGNTEAQRVLANLQPTTASATPLPEAH